MADLKVGDTVVLKSGSPVMTIARLFAIQGGKIVAECIWFDGVNKKEGDFPLETLVADDGVPNIA